MTFSNNYAVIESGDDGIPFQCVFFNENRERAVDFAVELGKEYGMEGQDTKDILENDGYFEYKGRVVSVVLCGID